ncbi:RNA polymerase II subunit A C-terminal domain phosphatase SSU72 isoform X4 [Eurytemora carolleeae]|uniref:RNA polymerase II subunit A C-terminal domain phosphatase SSU72 isoform X4 n=1 Tax=Eurytemora carolleeae TaxID=1294199 RepID=UPI000C7863B3|nr:RNA polymerase II subunit A C-terminal domain phosphatase SSU72 isoform X4 [Eurytemora carolleeae]|eukprot:XP_023323642.1 RNA polymerase II subunit A C-terminal domain phosphatase SSU72-like isoform X4 [Eurytemora affinis]
MEPSLRFAVVCSSNMNRSMEAHARLKKKGFNVRSFGTGDKIKLPGPSLNQPNVYEFGTSYEEIHSDLARKDKTMYKQNGILHMLDRNRMIKERPERLQDCKEKFDVIITAEERVYDQVIDHFSNNGNKEDVMVHVINIDIQDNQEEATIGAFLFHELAQQIVLSNDLDNEMDELLQDIEIKCNRSILHSYAVYYSSSFVYSVHLNN